MQFGSKPLFENISVKFGGGNRYGLIGANGSEGLILIAANYEQLKPYIDDTMLTDVQRETIFSRWPGPVTFVFPAPATTPRWLTGRFDSLAVRVTDHPLVMAVGVYQALYQAELQVPQDIAVIGYDDIELASFMTPPLTTIHQPKDELGELAIDVLIHRITQPTLQQQRLQLTPILMERGSA